MNTPRISGGLGSRVALRTYLLFCLCSVVPLVVFATLGYRYVNSELQRAAQERLDAASKRYGVLIFERLTEADTFLTERARLSLQRATIFPQNMLSSERVRVISVEEMPRASSSYRVLEVADVGGTPTVRIRVNESLGDRSITLVGEPLPEYLWNIDATDALDAQYCVYAGANVALHCTDGTSPDASGATLIGHWDLFLNARYATPEWTIRAEQPTESGAPALQAFRMTLLAATVLAIAIALLIGSIQIRRNHRPLAVLAAAARNMGRGKFDVRVPSRGGDEYAGLGRAFNRMAWNLRHQFHLLSTFGRIDRLMLERPAVDPVIESILPRARKLLKCDIAAVVLREAGTEAARAYTVGNSTLTGIELARINLPHARLEALSGRAARWLPPAVVATDSLHFLDETGIEVWAVASISVDNEVRGLLLLGFGTRPQRGKTGRLVSSLAHRIAVALGNEDRERALLRQAYYDSLTGLPNRQLFKDRLEQEIARSRASGSTGALLFIDLDRFKNVNDSLGHSAGDELLKAVADRLAAVVNGTCTLARLGGDEFTVIAPNFTAPAADGLALQILEALRMPVTIGSMQCVAEASIGIAMYPTAGNTAEDLIRNADTAMYRAKAQGRSVTVFFEDTMNEAAVRRLHLEQRLRIALERDLLEQHYQPKVHASDGSRSGFEALARWTDDELGPISPAEFVAVAEECGLVAKLDRWSLRTACRRAQRWRELNLDVGHLAVNVSLRHLDETFVDFVEKCLQEHGLPRGAVEIEITESTLADHPEKMSRLLERIRALGVRIAIDDFGTGYSSMAVLQKMPVDILKIDRSFVIHAAEDEDAAALLKAMVGVAHGLRKDVVAEGVETPAQAALLRSLGCELLQGYLYGRPIDAAHVEQSLFLAETRLRA